MPAPPLSNSPQAIARRERLEQMHMPGAVDYPSAPLELYDLQIDPGETTNVAKIHPEVVDRLRIKLAILRKQGHS